MTSFLAFFSSWLLATYVGTAYEAILVNFFVYVGATGTIYFAIGSLLIGAGADKLWITRRGRGRVTELKGVAWLAVSFAASVFLSLLVGRNALLFFAMACWVGWIAFQAYLSSRTSLRIATIAEPKKGGIAVGIGSFIVLLIGIGMIAIEAIAGLWLIPTDYLGIGTALNDMLGGNLISGTPAVLYNIALYTEFLWLAYGLLGLFALISLIAFFRYAGRGSALNIALMTVFIAVYSGYFLVNVLRRSGAPSMTPVDIAMSLFFLLYAMSGIGRTITEGVEERRVATRDFGPLLTFFLASGFFFVDSIISVVGTNSGSMLATWFPGGWTSDAYANFIFRDIAKLIAFPLAAIFSSLYYLFFQRADRVADRVRREQKEGKAVDEDDVDEDVRRELEEGPDDERPSGVPPPSRDSSRLRVDDSRRLGKPKRYGENDE